MKAIARCVQYGKVQGGEWRRKNMNVIQDLHVLPAGEGKDLIFKQWRVIKSHCRRLVERLRELE